MTERVLVHTAPCPFQRTIMRPVTREDRLNLCVRLVERGDEAAIVVEADGRSMRAVLTNGAISD